MKIGLVTVYKGYNFGSKLQALAMQYTLQNKYNAEVDANQIQNISDAFNEYKKIMEATVDMLNKKIELLDKENADLRDQIEQLRKQVFTLMKNNLENEYAGKKHTSKTHS